MKKILIFLLVSVVITGCSGSGNNSSFEKSNKVTAFSRLKDYLISNGKYKNNKYSYLIPEENTKTTDLVVVYDTLDDEIILFQEVSGFQAMITIFPDSDIFDYSLVYKSEFGTGFTGWGSMLKNDVDSNFRSVDFENYELYVDIPDEALFLQQCEMFAAGNIFFMLRAIQDSMETVSLNNGDGYTIPTSVYELGFNNFSYELSGDLSALLG